jgi:glycosyltransferase involved in cell wall biosynthesis
MNLLFLDQFSDLGGAQKNLLELLPAVRAAGWRALVGLPGEGELFQRVRALGFEAQRIDCGPYGSGRKSAADFGRFLAGTPRLAAQMRRMAQSVDAHVVFLNGPRLLPAAALAQFERPVLFHSHSYLGAGAVRRLAGIALRRLDAYLVGQCEFVAAPWRSFVRPERVSVIYNGVTGPPHALERAPTGAPRVGCIGRIAPEKGQREFVAAAKQIHRALPQCQFAIYGAPLFADPAAARYATQVRADAEGLTLEFAGWVDDIYTSLAQLDLLLVPSTGHEATTRVILEAFAAGVPVIAFPSGGIPEVIEDGVTGLLATTTRQMAQSAIDLLTNDPCRLHSIAQAAHKTWQRRFTLERYHHQILQAIEASCQIKQIRPPMNADERR